MTSNLQLSQEPGGLAVITFDRPGAGANIFDLATLDELGAALDTLEAAPPRALMLVSAKPKIFFAGADIQGFSTVRDAAQARALSRKGQDLFNRIAGLPCPTVAAIHGQALGGGCEMALACDWRVLSDSRDTRIGLPEILLGILPAWGGSHRLPRLIGLVPALDLILAGKTVPAGQALKLGLADRVVPRELLAAAAASLAARGKPDRKKFRWPELSLLRSSVHRKALARLMAKTRGLYPAPLKALEVVMAGFGRPRDEALRLEQDGLAELMMTPECANLIRVFFLQERAKKIRVADAPPETPAPVRRMAVVGAGVMGAGIAQWHGARGQEVLLRDISPDAVNAGLRRIGGLFADAVKRHALSKTEARQGLDRIVPLTGDAPLMRAELVIEAAPETMEIKRALFAELDRDAPETAILATNTSALSIDRIADAVRDPARVVGLHYFNPVHQMQLVEVVRGPRTSAAVVARAVAFAQAAGKLPVVVRDAPGFAVNRVLMPYLVEAGLLFAQGAPMERIDGAMLDFGMPMGPLRLLDEVGADTALHVARFLAASFPERMRVPAALEAMVRDKALGRKSGAGFYLHPADAKGPPRPNPGAAAWVAGSADAARTRDELARRMVFLMINECARCLEEGVAASADDIDFALVFGAGFAPFRGGPVKYAESLGVRTVVDALAKWAEEDPRFTPCGLLREMSPA
ncbi:MAG: 3-hydroxyacyl-CoA dehydrogenase NAD-binding domain-containing protein [Kiritimatiellia bacterium]